MSETFRFVEVELFYDGGDTVIVFSFQLHGDNEETTVSKQE